MLVSPGRIVGMTRSVALWSTERTLELLLRGPLVDTLARDLVRYRVIQRVVEPLVDSDAFEQIVSEVVDSPAAERVVAHVIESGVVDEAVARLLESEELWVLVDEIASSPAVTEAISHQSLGLAEQMAVVVRERSLNADARLERIARRALRRDDRAASNGVPPDRQP